MNNFDLKVDTYITNAEDFAKPILTHWRKLAHEHCPQIVEAIKWGYPHLDYKGDFMFVLAAYKKHCAFTFVKAELMSDERLKNSKSLKPADRFLGRITSLVDLPPDEEFIALIKEAMILNEKGMKVPTQKSEKPAVVEMPAYFAECLALDPVAKEIFESKSPSFRKDYITWIIDAKTEATRDKRIAEAIQWISEGKSRFWKYAK